VAALFWIGLQKWIDAGVIRQYDSTTYGWVGFLSCLQVVGLCMCTFSQISIGSLCRVALLGEGASAGYGNMEYSVTCSQ